MSTTSATMPTPVTLASSPPRIRLPRGRNLTVLLVAVGLAVMSMARIIAEADRLTSSTTIGAGVRLAVPIALAGIGGLWAERSGTVNIGLEGMMILGTVMAGWAGWHWGPVAALIAGAIGGAAGGLLMSLATTTFGVNHIIAGFAINIIGPGVARYLANVWFTTPEAQLLGGSISSSPRIEAKLPRFSVPWLSSGEDVLGQIEDKGWFFISDGAGVLRGLTADIGVGTILAVLLTIGTWYVLWRTPIGLRLRASGERPGAAESLGVSVIVLRHAGLVISGAFAGLGGAVLVFAGSNQYQAGQVAGRGFLGLAALVFGNWLPGGVAAGSAVFGYANGLAISLDSGTSVRGLMLAVAIGLLLVALVAAYRRSWKAVAAETIVAAVLLVTYSQITEVNENFVYMTPYIVTLVVITIFSKRQRPPAAAGIPYFKGESL